jgi:hypothetical protein
VVVRFKLSFPITYNKSQMSRERKRELNYHTKFVKNRHLLPAYAQNAQRDSGMLKSSKKKDTNVNRCYGYSNREEDRDREGYIQCLVPNQSVSTPNLRAQLAISLATEKHACSSDRSSDDDDYSSDDDSDPVSTIALGNEHHALDTCRNWNEDDELMDPERSEMTPGPNHYFESRSDSSFGKGPSVWRPSSKSSQFSKAKRWRDRPLHEWKQLGSGLSTLSLAPLPLPSFPLLP